MTLDRYKEKITDEILYRMAKEVVEHDNGFTPSSITENFWLIDLKDRILPGGFKASPYKARLHGHSIEIMIEGKWPIVLSYSLGRVIMGKYYVKVDCLERAVEDLRFMMSLIPKYSDEYRTAIENAAIEIQKEKMIQKIYESSVAPAIDVLLDGRDLTCETKCNFRTVTLMLFKARQKVKTFYVSYDNFQNELDEIKDFITEHFPLKC